MTIFSNFFEPALEHELLPIRLHIAGRAASKLEVAKSTLPAPVGRSVDVTVSTSRDQQQDGPHCEGAMIVPNVALSLPRGPALIFSSP